MSNCDGGNQRRRRIKSNIRAMADIRALLRAEQAARVAQSAPKPATQAQAATRKRKAPSEDDAAAQKRSRPEESQNLATNETSIENNAIESESTVQSQSATKLLAPSFAESIAEATSTRPTNSEEPTAPVDEDEWAAFERDVATPPPSPPRQSALNALQSNATISAAPKTREEIEAQQKEDLKQLREQKEEDLKAEKEDAARFLEDEFEEMEALEARVHKLKQMRENLRLRNKAEDIVQPIAMDEEQDDEDSDDLDEDYEDWGFVKS